MITYLLDTNICIFFNKGMLSVQTKLSSVGFDRCAISEIVFAELRYGVEKSEQQARNLKTLELFMTDLEVLPISPSIVLFAKEKARLKRAGQPIDNFDLLIGATARRRHSAVAACDHPPRSHAGNQQHQALPAFGRHPLGRLVGVGSTPALLGREHPARWPWPARTAPRG